MVLQGTPLPPGTIPPEVLDLAKMFFATVVVLGLGIPVIRAFTRRLERPAFAPTAPPDVVARLERIEQAVEAVAIEVERIAEAQRFAAKLMADQQQRPLPSAEPRR
jgi:hypothetical protein